MRRRSRRSRARTMGTCAFLSWGLPRWAAVLALIAVAAACGKGGEGESSETSRTLPVETTVLRIEALSDSAAVAAAVAPWARREGVEVQVVPATKPADTGGREDMQESSAFAMVEREGEEGTRWLVQPHGLLVRLDRLKEAAWKDGSPATWEQLFELVEIMGRKGAGLALPLEAEGLHRIFLPLWWAALSDSSIARSKSERLDAPAAAEAMAFLVQLSGRALRLPAEELEGAFLSGEVALLPCSLARARRLSRRCEAQLEFWPWPSPSSAGHAQALATIRAWVRPPSAPLRSLAAALAKELAGVEAQRRAARRLDGWIPAADDPEGLDMPLLSPGFLDALHPWGTRTGDHRLADVLDDACAAALQLRRSPQAALKDAQARLAQKN